MEPATYVKSLFRDGRHETNASPGETAVVAAFYITNHRDTTAVVTNPTGGKDWAIQFAKALEEVNVDCAIKHTDTGIECHITFRGARRD